MDRVPVARTVFAAFQRESLGKDGSCWDAEIPNTQGFGAGRTAGEGEPTPPEDVRGLFCMV